MHKIGMPPGRIPKTGRSAATSRQEPPLRALRGSRMNVRLSNAWYTVLSSYWILPTLMVGGAVALSLGAVAFDASYTIKPAWLSGWIYQGDADGARTILAAIAGSIATITGVVFSIMILVLAQVSSQFGPLPLRHFQRDSGGKVTLGIFLGTFLYGLLVMRAVRGGEDTAVFVPHASVTIGVALGLLSLAALIYFIQHMANTIQAETIIDRIGEVLDETVDSLFPDGLENGESRREEAGAGGLPEEFDREAQPILAGGSGYLQSVDLDGLVRIAADHDLVLRLERRPGAYVFPGSPLAAAWPGARVDDRLSRAIAAAFTLGSRRTPTQDVTFPVTQLTGIAVRSLSPGINDPFTAVICVERLGAALCRLAERKIPPSWRRDEAGLGRLLVPSRTFDDVADAAFTPIRRYGSSHAMVAMSLLETIAAVASRARRDEDRAALLQHALLAERGARASLAESRDRDAVQDRYRCVLGALGRKAT
jgi:uncharacterized membrane protein